MSNIKIFISVTFCHILSHFADASWDTQKCVYFRNSQKTYHFLAGVKMCNNFHRWATRFRRVECAEVNNIRFV